MDEAAHDEAVLRVLQARDGVEPVVVLADGSRKLVLDVAWGYDMGDVSARITTNISPGSPERVIDVILTSDVDAREAPHRPGVDLLSKSDEHGV